MEQGINNKHINMMFVTKPHNIATRSLSNLIHFMNFDKSPVFISSPFCIVPVGRSVCDQLKHIPVSPPYKRQKTDTLHKYSTHPFTFSLVFYLTTLLIPQFIHRRKWMNFLQVSAFDKRP